MKIILLFVFIYLSQAILRNKTTRIYVGTALASAHLNDQQYKTIAAQQFNCMTPENEMKWDAIEPKRGQKNYSPADELVQFAQTSGMKVRGHTLIWHSQIPKWVNVIAHNKSQLHEVMIARIRDEMTHYKGKIYVWDVVNEAIADGSSGQLRDSLWTRNFNESFISNAFKIAHSVDPTAKLYINDYSVEGINPKSDGLYNLVKKLKSEGVPIDGVGFQAHFIVGDIPGDLQHNLQRFADLGVDVAITELDIRIKLPSTPTLVGQQAKDYAKVFSVCEAILRCVGVTVWGFVDTNSWVPQFFPGYGEANLWDRHYKPKPAVSAIENVLY